MFKFRNRFLLLFSLLFFATAGLYAVGILQKGQGRFTQQQRIAQWLLLTDLCLTTESRHTRHISLPEWFAPFQDLPGYHDHFPSSTFFWPPPHYQNRDTTTQ